jgi:hypothetical protein
LPVAGGMPAGRTGRGFAAGQGAAGFRCVVVVVLGCVVCCAEMVTAQSAKRDKDRVAIFNWVSALRASEVVDQE